MSEEKGDLSDADMNFDTIDDMTKVSASAAEVIAKRSDFAKIDENLGVNSEFEERNEPYDIGQQKEQNGDEQQKVQQGAEEQNGQETEEQQPEQQGKENKSQQASSESNVIRGLFADGIPPSVQERVDARVNEIVKGEKKESDNPFEEQ